MAMATAGVAIAMAAALQSSSWSAMSGNSTSV